MEQGKSPSVPPQGRKSVSPKKKGSKVTKLKKTAITLPEVPSNAQDASSSRIKNDTRSRMSATAPSVTKRNNVESPRTAKIKQDLPMDLQNVMTDRLQKHLNRIAKDIQSNLDSHADSIRAMSDRIDVKIRRATGGGTGGKPPLSETGEQLKLFDSKFVAGTDPLEFVTKSELDEALSNLGSDVILQCKAFLRGLNDGNDKHIMHQIEKRNEAKFRLLFSIDNKMKALEKEQAELSAHCANMQYSQDPDGGDSANFEQALTELKERIAALEKETGANAKSTLSLRSRVAAMDGLGDKTDKADKTDGASCGVEGALSTGQLPTLARAVEEQKLSMEKLGQTVDGLAKTLQVQAAAAAAATNSDSDNERAAKAQAKASQEELRKRLDAVESLSTDIGTRATALHEQMEQLRQQQLDMAKRSAESSSSSGAIFRKSMDDLVSKGDRGDKEAKERFSALESATKAIEARLSDFGAKLQQIDEKSSTTAAAAKGADEIKAEVEEAVAATERRKSLEMEQQHQSLQQSVGAKLGEVEEASRALMQDMAALVADVGSVKGELLPSMKEGLEREVGDVRARCDKLQKAIDAVSEDSKKNNNNNVDASSSSGSGSGGGLGKAAVELAIEQALSSALATATAPLLKRDEYEKEAAEARAKVAEVERKIQESFEGDEAGKAIKRCDSLDASVKKLEGLCQTMSDDIATISNTSSNSASSSGVDMGEVQKEIKAALDKQVAEIHAKFDRLEEEADEKREEMHEKIDENLAEIVEELEKTLNDTKVYQDKQIVDIKLKEEFDFDLLKKRIEALEEDAGI